MVFRRCPSFFCRAQGGGVRLASECPNGHKRNACARLAMATTITLLRNSSLFFRSIANQSYLQGNNVFLEDLFLLSIDICDESQNRNKAAFSIASYCHKTQKIESFFSGLVAITKTTLSLLPTQNS
jgi:hypothetical protein